MIGALFGTLFGGGESAGFPTFPKLTLRDVLVVGVHLALIGTPYLFVEGVAQRDIAMIGAIVMFSWGRKQQSFLAVLRAVLFLAELVTFFALARFDYTAACRFLIAAVVLSLSGYYSLSQIGVFANSHTLSVGSVRRITSCEIAAMANEDPYWRSVVSHVEKSTVQKAKAPAAGALDDTEEVALAVKQAASASTAAVKRPSTLVACHSGDTDDVLQVFAAVASSSATKCRFAACDVDRWNGVAGSAGGSRSGGDDGIMPLFDIGLMSLQRPSVFKFVGGFRGNAALTPAMIAKARAVAVAAKAAEAAKAESSKDKVPGKGSDGSGWFVVRRLPYVDLEGETSTVTPLSERAMRLNLVDA